MSEVETPHDSQAERDTEEEVIFRENDPHVENSTPNMITANDLDVVIEGWERKFEHLSQCLREMQLDSEKANSTMSNIVRDGRAREDIQECRIEEMHAGLMQFLERCDPAHLTAPRSVDAPAASTPFTPTGVPSRLRHDFNFESPVNQATPTESTRNRDHYDARESTHISIDARNVDPRNTHPRNIDPRNTHPHDIDPRNRDHHDASNGIDARNVDPRNIDPRNTRPHNIDPRNQDHHDARDRSRDDYTFLVACLSRRYDPPEREEAHCAELRARTRRRNDEFAENLKNLAQRAYTSADQNMLDNLVVERFREGHGNEELKKHLCLYPSTGLQDLIGACVRFETHVRALTNRTRGYTLSRVTTTQN